MNIQQAVSRTSYPGRGIILGKSLDGRAVVVYFIMGRSVNSRNRVFVRDGEGIRTEAHDPSLMKDPSLIIYAPVRVTGNRTVVTNGDQTDTVFDHLQSGGTFESALRTRAYEPDEPNYTPRISGLVEFAGGGFSYRLSILRHGCGCERFFFEYEKPSKGLGHFIHTYRADGNPLPSFDGEPEPVAIAGGIDEVTRAVWQNLDPDNKVSLFVRFIDPATGAHEDRIVNKAEEA